MRATLFDGLSTEGKSVEIELSSAGTGGMLLVGEGQSWPLAELTIHERMGASAAIIDLPGGARLEVNDGAAFYENYEKLVPGRQWLHALESRWPVVAGCLLLTLAIVSWSIFYGIPLGAKIAAEYVPDEAQRVIGREAIALMEKELLQPSSLPDERQRLIRQRFEQLAVTLDPGTSYDLRFRHSEAFGANALALPSGIIVLTDELAELATDEQLVAVLAHEVGHVVHHHSMRALMQNSLVAGFLISITGDVGSAANIAAGLPLILLNSAYSRDFEREADDTAYHYLRAERIDPAVLGTLLIKLDKLHGRNPNAISLLSTHPGSGERLRRAGETETDAG